MKVLYYVGAIGESNYEKKKEIFFFNIKKISTELGHKIDVNLNIYSKDDNFENDVKNSPYIEKCFIHNKKGFLTQLFLTNPYNNEINNYDYIIFIVDDIKFEKGKIMDLIKVKNKYNLDIISPSIDNASHSFMHSNKESSKKVLNIVNAIEWYLYLVTPEILNKLFNIYEINNPFMWGHDFLLGYYGFKSGIYHDVMFYHLFRQIAPKSKGAPSACKDMMKYFKKIGFKTLTDIKKKYPVIIETICL